MIKRALVLAATFSTPAMAADKGPDVLEIYDRFVVTSAAGGKCLKPAPEVLTKFLENFKAVSTAARRHIREIRWDWTPQKVDEVMKRRADQLTEKTFNLVAKQGCDGKDVAALLKYFDAHAKWDPSAPVN